MKTRKILHHSTSNKEIKPKRNQPWILIGRTDAKAEAPILQPSDAKSQLIGKNSDAGKDWGQEEKGTKEDEMVGWHHRLKGHEFEQAPGDGEGQGSPVCCSPWGRRVGYNWAIKLNCCQWSLEQVHNTQNVEIIQISINKWMNSGESISIQYSNIYPWKWMKFW